MKKRIFQKAFSIFSLLFFTVSISYAKVPDIVLKQKEAVVTIYIYENDEMIAYGSGFIIDPDGIIATNYHVVSFLFKNPDTAIAIKIEKGEFIKAQKMLSLDETNDVALIKVEGKRLPSLKLSQDYKPKQGEDVFVIGSPFGLETTISNGIISSIRGTDEFLQITAPVSPGSSGSPVFNTDGEVIGIATLVMQGGQNLNFAIPLKYIINIRNSLQISESRTLKATIPSLVLERQEEKKTVSFEDHIKLAKEHSKNGRYNEAIEEYTNAISLKPGDAYLYLARGNVYKISAYLLTAPAPEPIPDSEAPAPETTDSEIIGKKRNAIYDKAIEDYSRAIVLQPDNMRFYYARACAYLEKEEWENSIKDLDKAIALKPDISFLYHDRGNAYREIKQYRRAIDDFTKAINLKPDKQKYLTINLSPYEESEFLDNFDANWYLSASYLMRAASYRENLQIKEAIKDYEKSITISPDNFASLDLNELYEKEGKLQDAVKFYSYVINLYPKKGHLYSKRAYFYEKLKQHDKALQDHTKTIELNPKESSCYLRRGRLYERVKQYDKAIKDYTQAITLVSDAGLYSGRGELYVKTNQKQKALHDFQKACDLNTLYCWRLTEYQKEIARGEKWVQFSSSKHASYYYDNTSIRQQPNKHMRVWTRMEVDDVDEYVKELNSRGLQTKGYENFSHALNMFELDCNAEQIATVSEIIYDQKGNTLLSYTVESVKIEPIVPDSIGDALYKAVCKGKK